MKLGLFYQSGYRIEACYHALNQFRKFYPTSPVALYEDNTDILQPIANKFNCVYKKTNIQGYNDYESGRPAFDLHTIKGWLSRIYEACITTLKDIDWVMNMEDDVWFLGNLNGLQPPFQLSGIGGLGAHPDYYKALNAKFPGTFGCGGSIFNRKGFIKAYNDSLTIDWDYYDKLAKHPLPSQWTDSALTFVFLYSKQSVGSWEYLQQFKNENVLEGKHSWANPINELEKQQGKAKVVHCWKPYYFPTEEQKQEVINNLKSYV